MSAIVSYQPNLLTLSEELHCNIFSYLDVTQLLEVEKVCVVWCRISNDESLWWCIAQQRFVPTTDKPGRAIKAQVLDSFIRYWKAICQIFPDVQNMTIKKDLHPQRALDQEIHKANWTPEEAKQQLLAWFDPNGDIWGEDPSKIIGKIQVYLQAGVKIDASLLLAYMRVISSHLPGCFDVICTYLAHFVTAPSPDLMFEAVGLHTWEKCMAWQEEEDVMKLDFPLYFHGLIKKMDNSSFSALIDGMSDMIWNRFRIAASYEDPLSGEWTEVLRDATQLQILSEGVTEHVQDIRKTQIGCPAVRSVFIEKDLHPQVLAHDESNSTPAQQDLLRYFKMLHGVDISIIEKIKVHQKAGAKINCNVLIVFMTACFDEPLPIVNEICTYLASFIIVPTIPLIKKAVQLYIEDTGLLEGINVMQQLNFPDYLCRLIKQMNDSSFMALIDEMASVIESLFRWSPGFSQNDQGVWIANAIDASSIQTLTERVIEHVWDIRKT